MYALATFSPPALYETLILASALLLSLTLFLAPRFLAVLFPMNASKRLPPCLHTRRVAKARPPARNHLPTPWIATHGIAFRRL